jgi:surfactin synthase thioesterase subunit
LSASPRLIRHTRHTSHLVVLDDGLARPRLLIGFGHAGAGTSWMQPLRRALGAAWGCCVVVLPGRERRLREAASESVGQSADSIAKEIHGLSLPRKDAVVLFGQSLGGLVAFETCRRLEATAGWLQPTALLVLGTPAPNGPPPPPEDDISPDLARQLLGDMPHALMTSWLPALRSDMALFAGYGWGRATPIDSPIIALRGREDPLTSPDQMSGWCASSRSSQTAVRSVPGGHLPTLACLAAIEEMFNPEIQR